jgi:hypothetical protein
MPVQRVCVCVCVCVDFYETTHTSNNPKKNRRVKVSCSWWPRWYFLIQHWTRVLQASSKTPSSNWSRRCITMFTITPDTLLWVFHVLVPVDKRLISTDISIWCKDLYILWLLHQRGFFILRRRQFCCEVWHRLIETGPSINIGPHRETLHNAHNAVTVGSMG